MAKKLTKSFIPKHFTTEELIELFGDVFAKQKTSREIEEKMFNDQIFY